jgi:PucR C-terminal helix-turn-helix domain/GGDEF-like domain
LPSSIRTLLGERLRARLPEIEGAAYTRLRGVADAPDRPGPDYTEGLRAASSAALCYLLEGVESGDGPSLRPPPAVLVQARMAARNGVGLDVVMRRCFAGFSLFGDFLMGEVERLELVEPELPKRLLREQVGLFERMLGAVAEEHRRETSGHSASRERRLRLTERLLAGELVETAELGYELSATHVGIAAMGPGSKKVLRGLATAMDRRLFCLPREQQVNWAWLGGRGPLEMEALLTHASSSCTSQVSLAIGEAAEGLEGWRLTHRQAVAALPLALRGSDPVVRYADVALLASVLHDELLATSLRKIYLDPLSSERDGGQALRETLLAYFEAEGSPVAAAAKLGITRQTVTNRLRLAERRMGRRLGSNTPALQAALQMRTLEDSDRIQDPPLPLSNL